MSNVRRLPSPSEDLSEVSRRLGIPVESIIAMVERSLPRRPLWLMPDTLDVGEVAEAIGISASMVRKLIEGEIEKLKGLPFERTLVHRDSVAEFIERCRKARVG